MSGHNNCFIGNNLGVLIKTGFAHLYNLVMFCSRLSLTPPCVYSNSRNDLPRVAQRYGTIAAHTRRRASLLVVFVVFCMHMYSFAGLIRRTPLPTFSDTAITDRYSDTTIFQLRAHWVRISWSIGSQKIVRTCAPWWESNPRLPACKVSTLSTRPGSPHVLLTPL